jgi:propanediol dehydratase large subunit
MPRHDNTFGGGNFDADDIDEWLTIQRDWQIDAGIEPVGEEELLEIRERAALAVQAVFAELGLPGISDGEVEVATSGYDAREMPDRDRAADVEAADDLLARGVSGLDVARALDRQGFTDVAEAVLGMQRQRLSADYLQTAAVIDADGLVHSAVNDPNEYSGPGTGYRLEGERWALLQRLPQVVGPGELLGDELDGEPVVAERGRAAEGADAADVVVAVGPAFGGTIRRTIADLDHRDVLDAVCEGIREGGGEPRMLRVRRVADVAFIAHDGARLSGSGVAIGLQSKGTAVIHRADLQPLDNLELFGMSPLYTLESYRAMGRNAAGYALGKRVGPVPTQLDNFARAKLIVRTTLLHARETQAVEPGAEPVELELIAATETV